MKESMKQFSAEELLFKTPMGDEAYFYSESLVVKFNGARSVVSTSNLNGGFRQDLAYIFNHSCGKHPDVKARHCPGMRGKTIVEHYASIASELMLPVDKTSGMGTAALIENLATSSREHHGVEVMAVATAGVDVNGGRAGDPASHNEFTKTSRMQAGTINVMLFINAKLDAGALSRAIITATEAKTVALQELMANSMYSEGLATGSGTDSMMVVGNDESSCILYNTGKHVLLGEMIGMTVKEAVSEALAKQTDMTAKRQGSIEWQSKRYGLTQDRIVQYCMHAHPEANEDRCRAAVVQLDKENQVVAYVAAITHLCDQCRWQILAENSLLQTAQQLLDMLMQNEGIEERIDLSRVRKHTTDAPLYRQVLSDTLLALAHILYHRSQN